jgi:hypothetical protein
MEAVLFERIGVEFFQEICSETPLLPELCPVKSGGVSCLRGATWLKKPVLVLVWETWSDAGSYDFPEYTTKNFCLNKKCSYNPPPLVAIPLSPYQKVG